MKYLTSQLAKSKAFRALALSLVTASLIGCGGDSGQDSGQVANFVELPTTFTSFYCPDEGVGEENCVLYNPVNPYARASINSTNPQTDTIYKWEFNNQTQSDAARFYLWATAHAQSASGENQYYTANSLHKIFTNDGNTAAQEQAKRAYRSLLDNFFGSETFAANGVDKYLLRNFVGDALVQPGNGINQLFADADAAKAALTSWGYVYDTATTTMSKITN
jgi:hypothetical protein